MSSGTVVNRLVRRTSPRPIASCAHSDLPTRLAIEGSGGPGRRREVRLDQPMQVDYVIAGLRAVDGGLGPGAPGALGARVVGKEADNVELGGIAKFVALQRFQFPAEHQVQALRLGLVLSLGVGGGHGSHVLEGRAGGRGKPVVGLAFALPAAKTQAVGSG